MRRRVDVWSIPSGIGDEIMALGVAQGMAKASPSRPVHFFTRYGELFGRGHGNLTIERFDRDALPKRSVGLSYLAKHRLSLMEQMARDLGVRLSEYPVHLPKRPLDELDELWSCDRQVVVIQTQASSWTKNKNWSEDAWKTLVELLPSDVDVVEVGEQTLLSRTPVHPGFRSLVGKTTIGQFATSIQEADVFVGPFSGGMHLAHAYKVPSVIIGGGYEANNYPYPLATQLGTNLGCSPCWLRSACPLGRQCLINITPGQVAGEIRKILHLEN